ncbi:MAG: lycopene cyclase domain-containing protein [bacterium]
MDHRFFYIIWASIFFLIWLALFIHRKNIRGEMLFMSILFGFGGIISQLTHLKDWWKPLTLTKTPIGIEDFIIGFSIGGIASVIYAELYHKKIKLKRIDSKKKDLKYYFLGDLFLVSFAMVFLAIFYGLNLNSFYSAVIAYFAGIITIYWFRKDLVLDSFASGIMLLILGSTVYYFLFLLYPDYIQKFWYLHQNWYSNLVLGIPIGEYIWFFLTGAFIGPLYEFVRFKRFVKVR